MSFNRTIYDNCAYDLQIKRSTDPGDYRLFGSFAENENQCYSYSGPIGSKSDVSVIKKPTETCFGTMADVESNLSWRSNVLNKCNNKKFDNFPVIDKPICSSNLTSQDTRFTNPIDNYRGMSLTSYMLSPYLYTNPQCFIQEINDHVGTNTRLQTKDCYNLATNVSIDASIENCSAFPNNNKCNT